MAHQHEHIDLTTLKEVERLLTSSEIAAADDASGRSISPTSSPLVARTTDLGAPAGEGLSALPRRR